LRAAWRRKLRLVPDHAGGDAIDIGNVGTAETERIAAASLLLFGGVGLGRSGPDRNRERDGQEQSELENPSANNRH
jgi:hypothetical protein